MSLNRVSANGANVFVDIETVSSGGSNSVSVSIAVDYSTYYQQMITLLTSINTGINNLSQNVAAINQSVSLIQQLGAGDGIHMRTPETWSGGSATYTIDASNTGNTSYIMMRNVSE